MCTTGAEKREVACQTLTSRPLEVDRPSSSCRQTALARVHLPACSHPRREQILDNSNPLVIQRLQSSDVVQQNPKPDPRAWIAPLAAHVVEQATEALQREREDEEDEFDD